MSGQPSAASGVWPRATGFPSIGGTGSGPIPIGGGPAGLPTVNNPNLPINTRTNLGNLPPPIPQQPRTPFPSLQQQGGQQTSLFTNQYAIPNTLQPYNTAGASNLVSQNAQNEAYQRRLRQLEGENEDRRHATQHLTQIGGQVLQGQMDIQEQVLEYQYMLENCMDYLDHQNQVIGEQSEELALIRAKMKHFEYLMDAFKLSKEGNNLMHSMSGESKFVDSNRLCCREPLALPAPSTSPFFAGGPTRVTASTFQPFNPRYRSPTSRATAAANLNGRRSITPSVNTNQNRTTANERPSRRFNN
ncbi:unnamed protein product [Adineta steineri]|uniref:Uncharacterized protein n=1 Tax=Adineta steineri TaxID=433720 RepID=A0A813N497_9BILA|nr:unnamed protein product [Adineta steineri]CAF3591304.1 unnamed protein product [Adineta steineri]